MSVDPLLSLSSVLDRIDSNKKPRVGLVGSHVALAGSSSSSGRTGSGAPVNATTTTPSSSGSGSGGGTTKPASESDSQTANDVWYEFLDPGSGKCYYHHYGKNETSWEKPASFIPYVPPVPPVTPTVSHSTTLPITATNAEYRAVGYFNQNNGRFSGTSTYWEQVSHLLFYFILCS